MDERQQYPYDQQPTVQFGRQPTVQWGAPPVQDPTMYYAPPPAPAPTARPRWKTPVIALVALVVGIAIGAAANGSKNTPAPTGSGSAATTSTTPSSAVPAASAPAPAAPAAPPTSAPAAAPAAPATSVVLTVSGNGIKTTKQFNVADNWSLKYTYDCSSFGAQGNFQVMEQGGENDGMPLVNELGNKGGDVTYQHGDAGQHSLEVNSECSWTVTVTSGDAG